MAADQAATDAAHCHMRFTLDPTKLDCTTNAKMCSGRRYLKRNKGTPTEGVPVPDAAVPAAVKAKLDANTWSPTRKNDGRFLGPPQVTEKPCFECPGPAPKDRKLYCRRTLEGTWIGWRWYRFVDQPDLNQVFASIADDGERDRARCFMQSRVERMHRAQNTATDSAGGAAAAAWFDAPQGKDNLPADKVAIDPALLVAPPTGLEVGFVPIPVYQRLRLKPTDCDVTLGAAKTESNPLPADYFKDQAVEEVSYDAETCPGNSETGGMTFPYVISCVVVYSVLMCIVVYCC